MFAYERQTQVTLLDACTKAWESGLGALRGPAPAAARSHHAEILFNHLVR